VLLRIAVATIGCCVLALLSRALYNRWENADLINFLVAWIPFTVSILIAFIPDKELRMSRRIAWRIGIIICGLVYSILLWHQLGLTEKLAAQDQKRLLSDAIDKSNQHSDEKMGKLRDELKDAIADTVTKSTSRLTQDISKVMPPVPEFAKLQFSFYVKDIEHFPMLFESMRARENDTFPIEFFFKNASHAVAAEKGDIWLEICRACGYSSVPNRFSKLAESPEAVRHMTFDVINHDIYYEPETVSVSIPSKYSRFTVSFKYACETCGPGENPAQELTVYVLPPLNLSLPALNR
jgi:hypothetical protein